MNVYVAVCPQSVTAGHGSSAELLCVVGDAWPYATGVIPPLFSDEESCWAWINATFPYGRSIRPQALGVSPCVS